MHDQENEPLFVSEDDFDRNPGFYLDKADRLQAVAVFDSSNKLVLLMGGSYETEDE